MTPSGSATGSATTCRRRPWRCDPELSDTLRAGLDSSAHGALVSGSGPTTVFLAESRTHAGQIEEGLREDLGVERVVVAPGPVPGAHVVGVGR